MSVRTRIAVDIVTEYGITPEDLGKIQRNFATCVHAAVSDTPHVKPSVDEPTHTSAHEHVSTEAELCRECVTDLARDTLS